MIKIKVIVLTVLLSLLTTPNARATDTCSQLNIPAVADDNLTVTVTSLTTTEKTSSLQLTINFKMMNGTKDKKIDEGSFKIFYTDGTSEPQYGFFGTLFPGDNIERSYTWEYLKSKTPMSISYNAGFFSSTPSSLKLNWAPPGQVCSLIAAADKAAAAAADKAAAAAAATDAANAKVDAANKAAELKAQAELKAIQEIEATAAVDFMAKQEAEAKTAAELKAKLEKEAKAAALRKTTIICVKGKLTKKVTSIKPTCPAGYKKK